MATVYRIIVKLADGWSAEDARASLQRSMEAVCTQGADGASAPEREDRKHPDARTTEIIRLDASRWTNVLDFYDAILLALGAPDWHGRCVNALIDSIIGGGINAVEPPYVIVIDGTSSIDASILNHIVTVKDFLAEVRAEVRTQWDRHVEASIEIVS